jgi:excisionase family DNA binding protein
MNAITTSEAAEKLGISPQRVNVLIKEGRLPATKVGPIYLIQPKDLAKVKNRKTGRPKKKKKKKE